MDELRLVLTSKTMRKIVQKIVSSAVRKKLGTDMQVQIHELEVNMTPEGKTQLNLKIEADTADVQKLILTLV